MSYTFNQEDDPNEITAEEVIDAVGVRKKGKVETIARRLGFARPHSSVRSVNRAFDELAQDLSDDEFFSLETLLRNRNSKAISRVRDLIKSDDRLWKSWSKNGYELMAYVPSEDDIAKRDAREIEKARIKALFREASEDEALNGTVRLTAWENRNVVVEVEGPCRNIFLESECVQTREDILRLEELASVASMALGEIQTFGEE